MKTWLITGVSSGFGLEISKAALAAGGKVVGTLRQSGQIGDFEALAPGRAKAVLLDITDAAAVPAAVATAEAWLGGIDVLVNNAGYGQVGVFEELTDSEFRRGVETNFFGAVSLTRAALPGMRARQRGDILNFSSVAAFAGLPGLSAYGAAKAALEAFSEALAAEVTSFGLRVMAVTPGSYRTSFRGGHAQPETKLAAYYGTAGAKIRDYLGGDNVDQRGDPARLAAALLGLLEAPELPRRFAAGVEAVAALERKLQDQVEAASRWKAAGEAAG